MQTDLARQVKRISDLHGEAYVLAQPSGEIAGNARRRREVSEQYTADHVDGEGAPSSKLHATGCSVGQCTAVMSQCLHVATALRLLPSWQRLSECLPTWLSHVSQRMTCCWFQNTFLPAHSFSNSRCLFQDPLPSVM